MKFFRDSLFLFGLLVFLGCGAISISFDVSTDGKTTISKGSLLEQLSGSFGFDGFSSFDISESSEFKNQNTQKDRIKTAAVKSIPMTIVGPDTQTFDFLEEVTFYIEAPGVTKKRIGTKKISKGVKKFTLDLDGLELAPYLKADSVKITTDAKGKRPENDTTIQAAIVLSIEATAL
jgi:hypothetical protein